MDEVQEATEEDLEYAVEHALSFCGLTAEQLKAQHRSGNYSSIRARMAWVAVGDLL